MPSVSRNDPHRLSAARFRILEVADRIFTIEETGPIQKLGCEAPIGTSTTSGAILLDRGDAIQQILPGHNRYPLAADWLGKAHPVFTALRENQATAEITTAWGPPVHRHHGGPLDLLTPPCWAPGASTCPRCRGRSGSKGFHDPIRPRTAKP